MSEPLQKIRDAYADAGREQAKEAHPYPALPAWGDMPIELREVFIHVYHAGAREALSRVEGGSYR